MSKMRPSVLLFFVLLLACGIALADAVDSQRIDCLAKYHSCMNDGNLKKPVCGDDNKTYSRCQIIRMQCEGVAVSLKYKGPCRDAEPCLASLQYLQKTKLARRNGYIPNCREDGMYAPVQCNGDSNCWCVTPQGVTVPNTSVTNGRPNCGRKSNTRRRSSMSGQRNKKGCNRSDKTQFNLNLINIFSTEYDRLNSSSIIPADKEKVVIEWKFNSMDKDKNGVLEKPEYRPLRKLIKKVVKPKRCAKTFARLCDMDHDEMITRQEWTYCISDDTHNYEGGARAPGVNKGFNNFHDITMDEKDDDDDDNDDNDDEDQDSGSTGVLHGSLTKVSVPRNNDDSLDRNKEDGDSNDCLSDRKSALDDQKNDERVLYVPECMPDGRYQRMQCYRTTGYCWCVHEDTGKNIPGTSIKDERPNCDLLPTPNRPMKGCPEQRKAIFLRDLMQYLAKEMKSDTNGSSIFSTSDNTKWQASTEEKIATWSFVKLDQNQNKVLERKEWKSFRLLVMDTRSLWRCGKKLPRYCDVNHDRKISLTEWLNCLNAQRGFTSPETTSLRPSTYSKRKGPNPLESYLKGD